MCGKTVEVKRLVRCYTKTNLVISHKSQVMILVIHFREVST